MRDLGHEWTERRIRKLEARIRDAYEDAIIDVEDKMAEYLAKFAAKDRKLQEQLKAGKITKADYQMWLNGQVFQRKRWQAMLDDLTDTLARANQIAMQIINDETPEVFAYNANWASYNAEKQLDAVLDTISDHRKNQLRIGTYSSISRGFLSELLQRFRKENPDIKLYISVVDRLDGWLEEEKADVIFADNLVAGDSEWIPLMEDEYSVVTPMGMFRDREVLTREEIYEYPHILIESEYLKDYFDEARFKEIIHLTSEDDLSVINMVSQGLGLTVLSNLLLKDNTDGVSLLRLEPPVSRTIGFAYKKHPGQSATALSRFVRYVKAERAKGQRQS